MKMNKDELNQRLDELRDINWLRGYRRDGGLLIERRKVKNTKRRRDNIMRL